MITKANKINDSHDFMLRLVPAVLSDKVQCGMYIKDDELVTYVKDHNTEIVAHVLNTTGLNLNSKTLLSQFIDNRLSTQLESYITLLKAGQTSQTSQAKFNADQESFITHRFDRPRHPNGHPIRTAGLALTFQVFKNLKFIRISFAVCDGDVFDQNQGRIISDKRMLDGDFIQIPFHEGFTLNDHFFRFLNSVGDDIEYFFENVSLTPDRQSMKNVTLALFRYMDKYYLA